jgi:hypothetical protein
MLSAVGKHSNKGTEIIMNGNYYYYPSLLGTDDIRILI